MGLRERLRKKPLTDRELRLQRVSKLSGLSVKALNKMGPDQLVKTETDALCERREQEEFLSLTKKVETRRELAKRGRKLRNRERLVELGVKAQTVGRWSDQKVEEELRRRGG